MRSLRLVPMLASLALATPVLAPAQTSPPEEGRVVFGFGSPVSAVWDEANDRWLVSDRFAGINSISKSGKMSQWLDMDQAYQRPLALALHAGTLYVGENRCAVLAFDVATVTELWRTELPLERPCYDGQAPGGIAVDPVSGDVYVARPFRIDVIRRRVDETSGAETRVVEPFFVGTIDDSVIRISGLLVDDGILWIVNAGYEETGVDGMIHRVALDDPERRVETVSGPIGSLQSVQKLGDVLYVNSRESLIWEVAELGTAMPVPLGVVPLSRLMGLDPARGVLAIPSTTNLLLGGGFGSVFFYSVFDDRLVD